MCGDPNFCTMTAIQLLALLIGAASAANSDVCTNAADYDGTAVSNIGG